MVKAPRPLQVFLADDSSLIREKLCNLITTLPNTHVCGEAESAAETITLVQSNPPDVIILDIDLKQSSGLEVIAVLHQSHPDVIIAILSIHPVRDLGAHCLKLGATHYFEKGETFDPILKLLDDLNPPGSTPQTPNRSSNLSH